MSAHVTQCTVLAGQAMSYRRAMPRSRKRREIQRGNGDYGVKMAVI